jgi:hypothetical protein
MTWSDFYLICFAIGFCFSFFSFVFGGSRFGRLHLPHLHSHGAHLPVAHGPVAHAPMAPTADTAHASQTHHGASVSPFNPPSIAAFLAWFGGTGYLLTRFSALWVGLALLLAVISGLVGAPSFSCSLAKS